MIDAAPRVTIGLPVYNGEDFLAEAIDSILTQTYEDLELVISDNASTDATEDLCRSYAAGEPRIRYERQPDNRGAAWNHNRVFERARGEYFKWAAHDDFVKPTYLERCLEVLDGDPGVVWSHSRSVLVDPRGHLLPGTHGRELRYDVPDRPSGPTRLSPRPHQRYRAVVMSQSNLDVFGLIRSTVMKRTGLMIPYYGMDKVFVAELCLAGRYQEVPEVLYFGRVHPNASGALPTSAEQQEFINPHGRQRFSMIRLHLLAGHSRAIRRADLDAAERARCFLVLVAYLLQVRKWKSVLTRAFRGSGTGGGFLEALNDSNGTRS
jgi:glycosyltransferase involved in cell wall biosynthesis